MYAILPNPEINAMTKTCNAGKAFRSFNTRSKRSNLKIVKRDPDPGKKEPATTTKSKQFQRSHPFLGT